ncbi:MAG: alpha-L-rhamnosidase N-terminal domain-containing protein, partial [Phycisphaeraceae bacterium JB051]
MSLTTHLNQQHNIMWSGDKGPATQTRLFRRKFEVTGNIHHACIQIFAEAKYQLYINGEYLDRGPCFHHPMIAPFDRIDLKDHLIEGNNVIAVLVQAINMGLHNHIPNGEPGLCVQLDWMDGSGEHQIAADNQWRVSDQTGWQWPAPKRTWAIGPIEIFDMSKAQPGWQNITFDDQHWQTPQITLLGSTIPGGVQAVPRPTPTLRYEWISLDSHSIIQTQITNEPAVDILADKPAEEHIHRLENLSTTNHSTPLTLLTDNDNAHAIHINGLTPDHGIILELDLGAMHVGQFIFDASCPTDGTIDIAWCEAKVDGKLSYSRKGACYADRIIACKGELNWRPLTFSGMRYVTLIFRGFTGDVQIHRAGIHASIPDLQWNTDFQTSDPLLNDIHTICQRTLCVGSQESLMDCPTREQAAYVGDGLPVAMWIGRLTGDWRYFKDMIIEQFRRQSPCGLIRSTLYSWRDDTLV